MPPRSPIWESVSKWLPDRDCQSDIWWEFTGPHLAQLLESAEYGEEAQYEALLFFYHHIVPRLGPVPTTGGPMWGGTLLESDGTPLEYSWRWNQAGKAPHITMSMEPVTKYTGTLLDEHNVRPFREMTFALAPHIDSLDTQLFLQVAERMIDYVDNDTDLCGDPSRRAGCYLGFDFLKLAGVVPKGYFISRKKGLSGDVPQAKVWADAILRSLPQTGAAKRVFEFINDVSKTQLPLRVRILSADLVRAEESCLKLYCMTTCSNWDAIHRIITLNGTIQHPQRLLDDFWELTRTVCNLPSDYARSVDIPRVKRPGAAKPDDFANQWANFHWYFEVGRGRVTPEIQIFIPTSVFCVNDLHVAKAITKWMEDHGRGEFMGRYLDCLGKIIPHRRLQDGHGAQTWLGIMIKDDMLEVTSHISPECYHPKRIKHFDKLMRGG